MRFISEGERSGFAFRGWNTRIITLEVERGAHCCNEIYNWQQGKNENLFSF